MRIKSWIHMDKVIITQRFKRWHRSTQGKKIMIDSRDGTEVHREKKL